MESSIHVLIGRPICIAAFGAGQEGVSFYLKEKETELKKAMVLTGCPSIDRIDPSVIVRERKGCANRLVAVPNLVSISPRTLSFAVLIALLLFHRVDRIETRV